MRKPFYYFADVTLLVTHYNRSSSLERLLKAFQDLNCGFEQVIISDGGSKPEHFAILHTLQQRHGFELVTVTDNKGLAHNHNKGQDAVKTPYTLYVQEDFIPTSAFAEHFQEALDIMKKDPVWDIIRLYIWPWSKYPYLKTYGNGFSEMVYKPMLWYADITKFFFYSDHPHLRHSNFLTKFGRYTETLNSDVTEWQMCLSFIRKKGKGLIYDVPGKVMFEHSNSEEEPGIHRVRWRHSQHPTLNFFRSIYHKYRLVKNTLELILTH